MSQSTKNYLNYLLRPLVWGLLITALVALVIDFNQVSALVQSYIQTIIYCFVAGIFAQQLYYFAQSLALTCAPRAALEQMVSKPSVLNRLKPILNFSTIKPPSDLEAFQHSATLRLVLFLFFVATEFSRPFFPIYVESFAPSVPYISTQALTAIPQMLWAVMALFGTPLGFYIFRRYGEKSAYLTSVILATVSLLVMASSSNYWLMLACRCTHALGVGIISYSALVSLSKKGSVSELGVFLGAVASGAICATVLGGEVAHLSSYRGAIYLSSFIALCSWATLYYHFTSSVTLGSSDASKRVNYALLLSRPAVHLYALLVSTPSRFLLMGFILYALPIKLHEMSYSSAGVGQIMMVYFAINYLLVSGVGRFLDATRLFKSTTLVAVVSLALGLLLFFLSAGSIYLIIISMACLSLGMTISNAIQVPLLTLLLPRETKEVGKEVLIAFFRTIERVAAIAGPALAALCLKYYPSYAVLIFALLMLSAALSTAVWFALAHLRAAQSVQSKLQQI